MPGITSGGGGGYDYVETFFPDDAEEGESLFYIGDTPEQSAAYVYNGVEWIEQTVTDHSQLSGVGPDTHHPQNHGNEDHTADFETTGGAQDRVENHAADADAHHDPVPSGVITMWSGSPSNVPSGWTLCDGNGAPDLRNRFIVGAGGQYNTDESGGESSVTLSESEIPSHDQPVNDPGHSHQYSRMTFYEAGGNYSASENQSGTTKNTSTETTGITLGDAGGDEAHENRPPYYALAFIMKT